MNKIISLHEQLENDLATLLSMQVELLVRAHDCYTLGCSVDGISEVLLVVRQWVPTLMAGKHFSLMVATLCYSNSLNICSTQFRTITIVSIASNLWEVRCT